MPGESICCLRSTPLLMFQSTPGINAGRILEAGSAILVSTGFNPRPALMPGESQGATGKTGHHVVSIHARH